jgi:uncharacterized RDD family membrane protein YckC
MQDTALSGLPDPDRHAEFYADVPVKRFIAWILDGIAILLLALLAVPFTAFTALFFFPLLWLLVGLVYRIVTIANWSATPGMRMMAIEFRTGSGARFDLQTAALHTLGYTVSMAAFPLQAVSIVLMLTTPRGQSLPDHMLGTAAINRRARY